MKPEKGTNLLSGREKQRSRDRALLRHTDTLSLRAQQGHREAEGTKDK
jgi:hypothetical protein